MVFEIKKELLNEFTIYIEETLPELKDDSTTNIDIQPTFLILQERW